MISPVKKISALLCLCVSLAGPAWAQQINNLNKWAESGFDRIGDFGQKSTPTYGQTFRLPDTYDRITSFSFQLRAIDGGDVHFVAYLSEWDQAGGKLKGPLLYSGGTQTLLSAQTNFAPFEFSIPALVLDPTKTYVAFISTSGLVADQSIGNAEMGSPNYNYSNGTGAAYTGGRFVYFNNDMFSLLYTSKWEGVEASDLHRDAAFVTNFSRSSQFVAVPEPSTYGLIAALTLGGAVAIRRLRFRAKC